MSEAGKSWDWDSPPAEVIEAADRLGAFLRHISPIDAQRVLEHAVAGICSRMGGKKEAIFVADGFHKHVLQIIDDVWEGDWDAWKDGVQAWKLPRKRRGLRP